MWSHAVASARPHGNRLRIQSDPQASGFYEAMGAIYDEDWEAHPGFTYRIYWYDLSAE